MSKGYSSTVVFLYDPAPQNAALGTAFLVSVPFTPRGEDGEWVPFIVTAKHVLQGRKAVVGRFRGDGQSAAKNIEWRYDLEALKTAGDYWEHPDPSVDLAVFRTTIPPHSQFARVPLSMVASKDQYIHEDISEMDRVVFPSLLVGLQGLSRDFPVTREGSIALLPGEPIPFNGVKSELILMNAAANQGSSGAPVFIWPGPRLKHGSLMVGAYTPMLLGIVKGFYNSIPRDVIGFDHTTNNAGPLSVTTGDSPPHTVSALFAEDSKIGLFTPSWKLRDIIESETVMTRIKQVTGTTPP